MGLYLLDYGAGNVKSLANSLTRLGYSFTWITDPTHFDHATSLIFPGVGSFQTAIHGLESRGLLTPLLRYIQSGRPYLGICIGMQVLFQSSSESPSSSGLGLIPMSIERFDDSDKTVPHIGWNSVHLLDASSSSLQLDRELSDSSHFYFVHSYAAKYNIAQHPALAEWVYTTTDYGTEKFVSMVHKDNVFGCQFHPEKSGTCGLALLHAWLSKTTPIDTAAAPLSIVPRASPQPGLTKRIIACMDVRANDQGDLVVTKGDQYDVREKIDAPNSLLQTRAAGAVRNLGKPVTLAAQYYEAGADEICLLNITSFRNSPLHDQPMLAIVEAAAKCVFVPLTIGGGIKDTVDPDGTKRSALEVAGAYFRAGADKVSIGSDAVYAVEKLLRLGHIDGSSVIEAIADVYGRQAVVISIDPKRVYVDPVSYDGPYLNEVVHGKGDETGKAWWYQCTVSGGRELRPVSVIQLAKGAETLGAGEILVNSIDRDGTGRGFDLDLLSMVKKAVSIPVIASSGAGTPDHFRQVFQATGVEAALAAGIFHRGTVKIQDVKDTLKDANVNIR